MSQDASAAESAGPPESPNVRQLVRLALVSGVPFVGFGIADNGIMILAGDYIDGTLGVKFGLSTLAAAGLGNLISDVAGIGIGEMIEVGVANLGLKDQICALQFLRTNIAAFGGDPRRVLLAGPKLLAISIHRLMSCICHVDLQFPTRSILGPSSVVSTPIIAIEPHL